MVFFRPLERSRRPKVLTWTTEVALAEGSGVVAEQLLCCFASKNPHTIYNAQDWSRNMLTLNARNAGQDLYLSLYFPCRTHVETER